MSIVDRELERLSDRRNQFATVANDFDAVVRLARELEAHCEAMAGVISATKASFERGGRLVSAPELDDWQKFKQERG